MDVTDYSLQSQVRAFEERQGLKVGDKVHFMDVEELKADGWHLDENKNAWTKENIHNCKEYSVSTHYFPPYGSTCVIENIFLNVLHFTDGSKTIAEMCVKLK